MRVCVVLDAGVFHHAHFQLDSANGGVSAALRITPNNLGAGAAPVTVFTNRYIPSAILGNTRLEFAGRNAGVSAKIDLDNVVATSESLQPLLLDPGGFMVVVHNLSAFRSRYGESVPVAGEFSGSLANEGDHLTLLGPLGEPILDFNYDPSWYPSTDGQGYSLVAVDPHAPVADWGSPGNWRPSGQPGGSPGGTDAAAPAAVLTINSDNTNAEVTLTWPATASGYTLYTATTFDPLTQWTAVTNQPKLLGDKWAVSVSVINRDCYYRLKKP